MSITRPALIVLTFAALTLAGCGEAGSADMMASAAAEPAAAQDGGATQSEPDSGATASASRVGMTATEAGAASAAGATASTARRRVKAGTTVKVVSSQFGRILADGRGQAFYYFDAERAGSRPRCYGACAEAWPPVLAKGRPVAGAGARSGKIGVTRRRNGTRQVTYAGRPLYYYVADSPGQVLCHNVREFGGLWVVIRPDGRQVG
jgi:predicted lipoprotein with Yx(FWY)xxD motif